MDTIAYNLVWDNCMATFSTSGKSGTFKFLFKEWYHEKEWEFGMIGRFLYMAEQKGHRWLYYKVSPETLSKEMFAKYTHELLKLNWKTSPVV